MRPAESTQSQTWQAHSYEEHARFVADLAGPILEWLGPKPGERILDLGCGDGVLSEVLAQLGCIVTGVDSSEDLLAAARKRGVDAQWMDGQALNFTNEFDAVFSNAALHWMTEAGKVIEGISQALRPHGRFVAEFGGHGNVAAIVTALRATAIHRGGNLKLADPWFFPSREVYRDMLENSGFKVKRIELIPRPTLLKTGMVAWLKVFRAPFFAQFGDDQTEVLSEVEELLRPALCDARGNWTADYVRLRVEAIKG